MKIAVVGIGCHYPGADNHTQLFENVLAGRRYFREMPAERWPIADYCRDKTDVSDMTYCRLAAVLEGIEFNPSEFKIPQSTYNATDQAQWLALLTARDALNDADQKRIDPVKTAVILGNSLTGETSRAQVLRYRWPYVARIFSELFDELGLKDDVRQKTLERIERRYKEPFAPVDEDGLAGALSNTIPGRVCNYFDFKGGGYTVDGACSSSLLAVIHACVGLENRDFDFVLAGGVDISLDPFELVGFAKVGALSATDIKVYDQRSSGFLPGEGCGVVALRRLEDAMADGDRIYATITGWGYSSDGKGGLTAPSVAGQKLAIERAYRKAGYGIDTVQLIEGHGTGTPVGDKVELSAVSESLERDVRDGSHRCGIGSIKSIIGHTKAAAGVAGFIKATLSVYHGILPPTESLQVPNELFAKSPTLYPLMRGERWQTEGPRRAGVSSAGFGGINTHVALEQSPAEEHSAQTDALLPLLGARQDTEVFFLAGDDSIGLLTLVRNLRSAAQKAAFAQLADLAAYCAKQSGRKLMRVAVVADTPQSLVARLDKVETILQSGSEQPHHSAKEGIFLGKLARTPRVAFLFPGQGSQRLNAGRLWRERFKFINDLWSETDKILDGSLPRSLSGQVFRDTHKESTETQRAMQAELDNTSVAQPAILAGSMAAAELMRYFGIEAEMCVGHSLGEYSALWYAGALSAKSALHLVAQRGKAMSPDAESRPGAMLSISADAKAVADLVKDVIGYVTVANYNAPNQTVVSGDASVIDELQALCRQRGLDAARLPVTNAFHSRLMEKAQAAMATPLAQAAFEPLKRLYVSTTTGGFISDHKDLPELLRTQITAPVRYIDAVETLLAEDYDLLVEVGPGSVLSRLSRKIVGERPVMVMNTDAVGVDGAVSDLNNLLAYAFATGLPVRTSRVFEGRFLRPIELPYRPVFMRSPCEAPVARLQLPHDIAAHIESDGRGSASIESEHELRDQSTVVTEPALVTSDAVLGKMRSYISKQFGYPLDMVHAEARFKEDLNLDSIKSVEVVAEAMDWMDIAADPTVLVGFPLSEVARKLLAMKDAPDAQAQATIDSRPVADLPPWVRSFEVRIEQEPLAKSDRPLPKKFVVVGADGALLERLAARLREQGSEAATARSATDHAAFEGAAGCIVVLPQASRAERDAKDLFEVPQYLLESTQAFLAATKGQSRSELSFMLLSRGGGGYLGRHAAAVVDADHIASAGFAKTLHLENVGLRTRVVDIAAALDVATIADIAVNELGAAADFVEVGYPASGERLTPSLQLSVTADLPKASSTLSAGDVLLVSGGARGITAECALDLARRYDATLVVLGSSPLEMGNPKSEVARNMQRFQAAGLRCSYYQCDLTNAARVAESVAAIRREHGPVAAVLHGAGLNRLHRIETVSAEEFVSVLKPKIAGLNNLLDALDLRELKVLAAFSSVIAKSGMPGNSDYAYANEWLNLRLDGIRARHPNVRCLSYNFSVWADVGMGVDSVNHLRKLGIDAIPVDVGVGYVSDMIERDWPATDLVISSRLGGLPTVRFPAASVVPQRFLENILSYQPGVELVSEVLLRKEVDRYLAEHDYHGSLLFPAVMGMEAMAQVSYACAGVVPQQWALTLQDLRFERPIVVRDEGRAIRVYAQVVEDNVRRKVVRVKIRSSITNYESDYFSANCVLSEEFRQAERVELKLKEPLSLKPKAGLYGGIFFQGPMFQNIASYHDLTPKYCEVRIKRSKDMRAFAADSGWKTLFGSPEVRDSFLHAVQACVPEYRILPVGIDEIISLEASGEHLYMIARERFRTDNEFCYDLQVFDRGGAIVEELKGFRCRIMEPYRDETGLKAVQALHTEAAARNQLVAA